MLTIDPVAGFCCTARRDSAADKSGKSALPLRSRFLLDSDTNRAGKSPANKFENKSFSAKISQISGREKIDTKDRVMDRTDSSLENATDSLSRAVSSFSSAKQNMSALQSKKHTAVEVQDSNFFSFFSALVPGDKKESRKDPGDVNHGGGQGQEQVPRRIPQRHQTETKPSLRQTLSSCTAHPSLLSSAIYLGSNAAGRAGRCRGPPREGRRRRRRRRRRGADRAGGGGGGARPGAAHRPRLPPGPVVPRGAPAPPIRAEAPRSPRAWRGSAPRAAPRHAQRSGRALRRGARLENDTPGRRC